jgi:4-amino-4-deoxy-L-arabinose transferase-like glycosyltransferase
MRQDLRPQPAGAGAAGASAAAPAPPRRAAALRALRRPRPELLALLVLAAVLDGWALGQNGWANDYYSAAVRSMAGSWHAFLYGSFDPSGVMTVDKPPLSLWVQALSVRAFGFHSLSVLAPQALMGVASVGVTYDLARRPFGRAAGFVAGLALAVTPVAVAVFRYNNPDALLVLCCVGALWCTVRALEGGRARWLVLAGVCVGLGFEAKMAAALLVVPGIVAAWLWVAPRGRVAALKALAGSGAAAAVVGLAWPLLVTLTPASSRPWISGTSDNSVWSLIFNYNGVGRLAGQSGGPGGAGGPGGGGPFGGGTGILRLLNDSLGGQAGWLLGAAVVSGLGLVVLCKLRRRDARTGFLVAVGGAFATIAVAFSFAQGIFHPYYTSQLAPFAAALAGAAVGPALRAGPRGRLVAGAAVAGGVLTELAVVHNSATDLGWAPWVLLLVAAPAGGLVALGHDRRVRRVALGVAVAGLLAAPTAWAADTLGHGTSGTFPAGGPASAGLGFGGPGGGGPGGMRFGGAAPSGGGGTSQAAAYAKAHGGGTVVVASQSGAARSIISSDASMAGIGGFSGRESSVTVSWLADQIQAGRIRWVLADSGMSGPMGNDGRPGSSAAIAAVAKTCRRATTVSGTVLYDCAGRAGALRAAAG